MVNDPTFNYEHLLKIASRNPKNISTQSAIRRLKQKYDITFTGDHLKNKDGSSMYQWICKIKTGTSMVETGTLLENNGIPYTFQDIGNDTVWVGVPRHKSPKAKKLLGIMSGD